MADKARKGRLQCAEARDLIEKALYDSISPDDQKRLDDHLARCVGCRVWWQVEEMTRQAVKSFFPRVEVPSETALQDFWAKL